MELGQLDDYRKRYEVISKECLGFNTIHKGTFIRKQEDTLEMKGELIEDLDIPHMTFKGFLDISKMSHRIRIVWTQEVGYDNDKMN